MTKIKANIIVDFLAAICFLVLAKTGFIMSFFFEQGIKQGGYQEFFGITKRAYSEIHNWAGIIFFILILLHVILHWSWIANMIKNLFKKNIQS